MGAEIKLFGLVGRSLSHSFSQKYFEKKFLSKDVAEDIVEDFARGFTGVFEGVYKNFEISDISQIGEILSLRNLQGFNVTVPYKESIIPFLDIVDDVALEVGAVNTVKRIAACNGGTDAWKGYNTDVIGFEKSLLPLLTMQSVQALVFGTGGASRAVQYVLKKNNIAFSIVGRNGKGNLDYSDLTVEKMRSCNLFINTTSVGMFPNIDNLLPLPYEGIVKGAVAYDLIYNPAQSLFLQRAAEQGAIIKNGLEMLYLQADAAWEVWK